jgi:hypothetical protein
MEGCALEMSYSNLLVLVIVSSLATASPLLAYTDQFPTHQQTCERARAEYNRQVQVAHAPLHPNDPSYQLELMERIEADRNLIHLYWWPAGCDLPK